MNDNPAILITMPSYPVSDLAEFSLNSSVFILSMIAGSVGRFLWVGVVTVECLRPNWTCGVEPTQTHRHSEAARDGQNILQSVQVIKSYLVKFLKIVGTRQYN